MNIYYEDIMENIEKDNLREKLKMLVKTYGSIKVIGLTSSMRYLIYKEMYHPLKFEKIIDVDEENDKITNIKIFNYKIKSKNGTISENENKNKNENENENENEKEDDFVLSDDETVNDETETSVSSDYTESYITDEEEYNIKHENIIGQCLEKISTNKKTLIWINNKVNFLLLLNLFCWVSLYLFGVKMVYKYESWNNYDTCSSDNTRMLSF